MRSRRWPWVIALAALVAGGCYDPHVRARLACGDHGECPGDQRCVEGICGGDPSEPDSSIAILDANLVGPYDLTVHLLGPSVGLVRSTTAGIACGTDCSESYPRDTQVTLQVVLSNGSGLRFAGWRGDCSGIDVECVVTIDGVKDVSAEFAPITHNLVFVTRTPISTALGSAAQYDARCNAVASAAGLNSASGDGFTAWISDASSSALQRMNGTGARGFVRMDGLPFTASMNDLVVRNAIYNPVLYDEGGRSVGTSSGRLIATGTAEGGGPGSDCAGWTGGGNLTLGLSTGGPRLWTSSSAVQCAQMATAQIYCMQHTRNATLDLLPQAGPTTRAVFLSKARHSPGAGRDSVDAVCASEAPVGPTIFKALLPRGIMPASALLDASVTYTTMSGQLVGRGLELINAQQLHTGIWEHADGSFFDELPPAAPEVLTGGSSLTMSGASSCAELTQTSGDMRYGIAVDAWLWWNRLGVSTACSRPLLLYCVQQ
ncbi:MAG: hypothetical protein IT370_23090 [Deltaproteobacteria bacterium]|nr:hypothetical protein [Deltaproteobacteria bacterium]